MALVKGEMVEVKQKDDNGEYEYPYTLDQDER